MLHPVLPAPGPEAARDASGSRPEDHKMNRMIVALVSLLVCALVASCGPKAPETGKTTPEGEASTTEIEDVEGTVEVEETTEETAVDEDEEMAPPEG
jgi:hypothetical protein